jgi:hypothetical protein
VHPAARFLEICTTDPLIRKIVFGSLDQPNPQPKRSVTHSPRSLPAISLGFSKNLGSRFSLTKRPSILILNCASPFPAILFESQHDFRIVLNDLSVFHAVLRSLFLIATDLIELNWVSLFNLVTTVLDRFATDSPSAMISVFDAEEQHPVLGDCSTPLLLSVDNGYLYRTITFSIGNDPTTFERFDHFRNLPSSIL